MKDLQHFSVIIERTELLEYEYFTEPNSPEDDPEYDPMWELVDDPSLVEAEGDLMNEIYPGQPGLLTVRVTRIDKDGGREPVWVRPGHPYNTGGLDS